MKVIRKKSNGDVFRELFDLYYADMHTRAMCYVFDHETADDIVQNVFVYLYEHAHLLESIHDLKAYLKVSVRNASLNYLRKIDVEDKRAILYSRELIAFEEDSNILDMDNNLILFEKINAIIADLPDKCREIFHLRFVEENKITDIAERLSLSPNTVKVQIHRAVTKIKDELKTQGIVVLVLCIAFFVYTSHREL